MTVRPHCHTASEIRGLLRVRYPHPEWALCFEVANSTGAGARRYADAVAMCLYPSRGLALHGFEIKCSKQDFLAEIKNPDKSVAVQKYCDHWWIVAPAAAVDESLLPKTWGWLRVDKDRLVMAKAAPDLDATPITRAFMASLVRRANEVDASEFNASVHREIERQRSTDRERIEREVQMRTRKADEAVKRLDDLKAAIGTDSWDSLNTEEIAQAVKMVRTAGVAGSYGHIRNLHKQMQKTTRRLGEALEMMTGEQADLKLSAAE